MNHPNDPRTPEATDDDAALESIDSAIDWHADGQNRNDQRIGDHAKQLVDDRLKRSRTGGRGVAAMDDDGALQFWQQYQQFEEEEK